MLIAAAPEISFFRLALAAIPCLLLLSWMFWQALPTQRMGLGLSRMMVQLLLIGYLLQFIFAAETVWVLVAAMLLMSVVAAWIATGSIPGARRESWWKAVTAIGVSGTVVTIWILAVVLQIDPTNLRTAIPLTGMIFSNSINSVSIAGERFVEERQKEGSQLSSARQASFTAAMIPVTNALFAVGVVSIPGMMTGQILDGADPQIAARYQIMVMLMLLSSSGLSALIYLTLESRWPASTFSQNT